MRNILLNKNRGKFVWAIALMLGLFAFSNNASAQLINEILSNPNGADSNCEYVEIIGSPSGALNNIYFASIEGDGTSLAGAFDRVVNLSASTLGTNGLLVITNDGAGDCDSVTYDSPTTTRVSVSSFSMENGTNSFALISSPTTTIDQGTDYDSDDNGTLDALPADATILDGFGFNDGGGTDVTYGPALMPTASGGADAATRFPGNTDASSLGAWYYGDVDGANPSNTYDSGQVSGNFPTGGMLTPGAENVPAAGGSSKTDTDFDGDGTSDYAVARDETPATLRDNSINKHSLNFAAEKANSTSLRRNRTDDVKTKSTVDNLGAPTAGSDLVWYSHNSGTPGTFNITGFGSPATDQITPADFDGDGKDDVAVWRGVAAAGPSGGFFFILNSSDSTVDVVDFGVTGDEAGIVGDYDGDGKADPAVFRQPGSSPFGQTTFFYKGSAGGGEVTFQPWGDNSSEDLRAVRGDYDGDGKHDFVIHRTSPDDAGKGQYVLLRSSDGGVEYINYGDTTDLLFPGDIDGDGMSDFIKVRIEGGTNIAWYVMTKDGSRIDAAPTNFGTIGLAGFSEFATIADYDGDGKDDIAIYRRDNTDFDNCYYYILRSSDGALQTYEFGASDDTPVQVWDQQF